MALAFISVFVSLLWRFLLLGLRYCGRPGAEQFPVPVCPGQWLLLKFMCVLLDVVGVLLCLVVGAS